MPKKKFVLRVDEETMKIVEKWAADEFRSVNGQLEWMITKMLRESNRLKTDKDTNNNKTIPKEAPKS